MPIWKITSVIQDNEPEGQDQLRSKLALGAHLEGRERQARDDGIWVHFDLHGHARRAAPKRRGRPKKKPDELKWKAEIEQQLVADVERLMADRHSERGACAILVRQRHYPTSNVGTLRRQFVRARKRWRT